MAENNIETEEKKEVDTSTTDENKGVEMKSLDELLGNPVQQPKAEPKKEGEPVDEGDEPSKAVEANDVDEGKKVEEQLKFKDEDVLAYLKEKGIEADSLDNLGKPKEVNPYEDLLDDDDKGYFEFKKQNPGSNRKDYEASKIDYDKVSASELAIEKVKAESGLDLTNDEALSYLEEELGFDINGEELSVADRIKLNKFVKDFREDKKTSQKKVVAQPSKKEGDNEEIVRLDNGQEMPKAQYDKMVADRNNYLKANEEAVNRVAETSLKITVDDNETERELSYSYKFDKEDKHRMLSNTNDLGKALNEMFGTENGGYDQDALNENFAWFDPKTRNKMLKQLLGNAYGESKSEGKAEGVEEALKDRGNVNLSSQKGLPRQEKEGVKVVPVSELFNS